MLPTLDNLHTTLPLKGNRMGAHVIDLRGFKVFIRFLQTVSSKVIIVFEHSVFTAISTHRIFLFHFINRILASPVNTVHWHREKLQK